MNAQIKKNKDSTYTVVFDCLPPGRLWIFIYAFQKISNTFGGNELLNMMKSAIFDIKDDIDEQELVKIDIDESDIMGGVYKIRAAKEVESGN